jgi:hypothetical protein
VAERTLLVLGPRAADLLRTWATSWTSPGPSWKWRVDFQHCGRISPPTDPSPVPVPGSEESRCHPSDGAVVSGELSRIRAGLAPDHSTRIGPRTQSGFAAPDFGSRLGSGLGIWIGVVARALDCPAGARLGLWLGAWVGLAARTSDCACRPGGGPGLWLRGLNQNPSPRSHLGAQT